MAELKPCSVCGNTKLVFNIHWPDYRRRNPFTMLLYGIVGDPVWYMACPRCGAYSAAARTKDEAINNWNKMIPAPKEKGRPVMKKCGNCANFVWGDHKTPLPSECVTCVIIPGLHEEESMLSNWKEKTKTNADRFRAMTDEELAKMRIMYNDYRGEYETDVGRFESYKDALSAELKYLQSPAEETQEEMTSKEEWT